MVHLLVDAHNAGALTNQHVAHVGQVGGNHVAYKHPVVMEKAEVKMIKVSCISTDGNHLLGL